MPSPETATLVLARCLVVAGLGVATALTVAVPAARLLRAVHYDLGVFDPLTITSASGILVIVAGLACYLPARTATRLDPLIVLTSD